MTDKDLQYLRSIAAEDLDPDEPPKDSGFVLVGYNYDDYERDEQEDYYMVIWRKGSRFFGCHLEPAPPLEKAYAQPWTEVFPSPRVSWRFSRTNASGAVSYCTGEVVRGLSAPADFVY